MSAAPATPAPTRHRAPDPAESGLGARARTWLRRWGPVLPLLIAEGIVWVGFGALLPILPIWFTEHGTDLPTLGLVIAAWPAARLVGEPLFGRLADTGPRNALMVGALLATAVFTVLPLLITGPLPFLVLRALAGASTSAYDPAARGYLADATPSDRQGEAFGVYAAAQMGGLMLGPAIGGVAAAVTGAPEVVFWVAAIALVLSAILVAARLAPLERHPSHVSATGDGPATRDGTATGDATSVSAATSQPDAAATHETSLANRLLLAAVVINVGAYFAGGAYEVVWSLYLTSLGADLATIGLTFATFGIPILLLSPITGRIIDRRGGYLPLVVGMLIVGASGVLYTLVAEIWWVVVFGLFEGVGVALASPALFALVARAAPPGRSSTAQGIFGAAGTVGMIVASLGSGVLADIDLRLPYVSVSVIALTTLLLGLAAGRGRLRRSMAPKPAPIQALV